MADGIVARLKILLGIDSADVTTGARKAEKEVSKMSKGISGAAKLATAALGALGAVLTVDTIIRVTKQALEFTTAIKKQALEAGVTATALQELRYAALQAGVSNDQLTDGLKELTLKLGEAAGGSKSASAIFSTFGINIRDANGQIRNSADVLPELADAYNSLKSPAERAALAAKTFGEDAGPKMQDLLEQGSAGMASYRQAAHDLGMVISDVNIKKAEEAEKKMAALNRVLSVKIATFVAENANAISALVDQLVRLAQAATDAFTAWNKWQNRPAGPAAQEENLRVKDPGYTGGLFTIRPATQRQTTTRTTRQTDAFGMEYSRSRQMPLPKGGRGGGRGAANQSANAIGGSAFGGTDWTRFTPTAAAADWIKAASASGIMAEKSIIVETMMKRIAMEYGAQNVRNHLAVAKGMERQAEAAQRIMDRLFPEEAANREYMEDMDTLRAGMDAGTISAERLKQAQAALTKEWLLAKPASAAIAEGFAKYTNAANDAADKSGIATVRIAQTFDQMAQNVLSSLNQLSNSIRGGGFLNILTSVVGLGLQLGNAGVFGKSIQGSLNKVPGLATGGSMVLGGRGGIDRNILSLNGSPLARVSAGERMTISPTNDRGGSGGGGMVVVKVVEGALFRPVIESTAGRVVNSAAPGIASAGASGGLAQMRRSGQRRVA